MTDDIYSMNKMLQRLKRESYTPNLPHRDLRPRSTSFAKSLIESVVQRAEREGEKLEIPLENESVPPPPPQKKTSVLPPKGAKRTPHGIIPPSGIFGAISIIQDMSDEEFLLFYIEASREYEERTARRGWTQRVVDDIMSFRSGSPEDTAVTPSIIGEETPARSPPGASTTSTPMGESETFPGVVIEPIPEEI
ncbi:MAG: hypothetical protein J7L61_04770 [Thermoplasmata archaeon]|nr:hypothetical protein [Thermoplasmata archaeon]